MVVKNAAILVVGGGLAGCWAALRAAKLGQKVILIDKAKVGRSGASTFAAGVMLAPQADDDLLAWQKEIVERGDYLNDQRMGSGFIGGSDSKDRRSAALGGSFRSRGRGKPGPGDRQGTSGRPYIDVSRKKINGANGTAYRAGRQGRIVRTHGSH